jgi:hypothetical protein
LLKQKSRLGGGDTPRVARRRVRREAEKQKIAAIHPKIFSILLLREIELSGRSPTGNKKSEDQSREEAPHEGHRMENPDG